MKIFRIAFVAAALCAMAVPASSQELYGTLKKVRDTKTFTIGFREASFPFAYYDEQKKPVGFSVELCNRIGDAVKGQLKIPDLAVRYLPINAQTRIPLLTNGTIDIECGSTTNNLARQQQVDFSYSVYVTGGRLLVSKASGIKEIEDLSGKGVGVSSGSSNERVELRDRPCKSGFRHVAEGARFVAVHRKLLVEEHQLAQQFHLLHLVVGRRRDTTEQLCFDSIDLSLDLCY